MTKVMRESRHLRLEGIADQKRRRSDGACDPNAVCCLVSASLMEEFSQTDDERYEQQHGNPAQRGRDYQGSREYQPRSRMK